MDKTVVGAPVGAPENFEDLGTALTRFVYFSRCWDAKITHSDIVLSWNVLEKFP